MRKNRRGGLALAGLALQCGAAGAWSPAGHERIGRVAEHLLVGTNKDRIRSMMHSGLPDISEHEEQMNRDFPETHVFHLHRQDPEFTCDSRGGLGDKAGHVTCDGHGAANGSLFCALAYFWEHFAHDALLKEFPAPKEPINTPEQLYGMRNVPKNRQKSPDFLKWLAILIGDMHQPLHWLHENDYGRDIVIHFNSTRLDLLTFWEEYIPNHLLHKLETGASPFMVDKTFSQHSKKWAHKVPTELFREWAKEVAEKVCTEVHAPMVVNHADGTKVESPFTLTDELFQKWVVLAEDLLQLAGERLGFVLNEIIEHKRHKDALNDGRGLPSRKVAVDVEKKERKDPELDFRNLPALVDQQIEKKLAKMTTPAPGAPKKGAGPSMTHNLDVGKYYRQLKIEERSRWRHAFMSNIGVAVCLVPALLALFSWHDRIGGGLLLKIGSKLKI